MAEFAVRENNEFGTADQRKLHSPEGAKNNGKWGVDAVTRGVT
jgi:hypothetical protein